MTVTNTLLVTAIHKTNRGTQKECRNKQHRMENWEQGMQNGGLGIGNTEWETGNREHRMEDWEQRTQNGIMGIENKQGTWN